MAYNVCVRGLTADGGFYYSNYCYYFMSHTVSEYIKGTQRQWNLESIFLGLLGVALIYVALAMHPELSIVEETIVLVIFLGALLGVAPIPFPNLKHRLWLYPLVAGILSAFMDSFLVLLMVAAIPMKGEVKEILKFKAYAMIAALIGGLLIYFGEVYALPHYLKYGMHNIYDGLPVLIPVLAFLSILGYQVINCVLILQGNHRPSNKVSTLSKEASQHQVTSIRRTPNDAPRTS